MIVHRYLPYDENDDPFDPGDLMAKVAELIMKYQLDMDEALKMMLAQGQVPNLFLKAVGLTDFMTEIIRDLQRMKQEIIAKYNPEKNKKKSQKTVESQLNNLRKVLSNKTSLEFVSVENSGLLDNLYRLRWNMLMNEKKNSEEIELLDKILNQNETLGKLERALKSFEFSGNEEIPEMQIDSILRKLFDLDDTINALEDALSKGDFQTLDLNKLAQAIGPEKIQEFLELQQNLVNHMREVLEKNGFLEMQSPDEAPQISSRGIDYISSRALTEFYSQLQSDPGGMNLLEIPGESEHTTSKLKDYQFGDNFSNVDWPASIVNSLIKNRLKPALQDLEVYESRGSAKNALVVLLDMSGSMFRYDRFYHAKKMIFALDKLIKKEYPNDKLEIIGFGSLAKRYNLHELFTLQPFPVLFTDPLIKLQIDLSKRESSSTEGIPLYFTNLQRGLTLSRRVLASKETKNRQIILITDGVPTAHMEGSVLHMNYPPGKSDFESALSEARVCREEGIVINTFLLSSEWWENFSTDPNEQSFAYRFVKMSGGRFFQSHPYELGVTVLYDYISGQKKHFRWGDEIENT